jgi:hypothetical protein
MKLALWNTPDAGTLSPLATVTVMSVRGMKQRPQWAAVGAETVLCVERVRTLEIAIREMRGCSAASKRSTSSSSCISRWNSLAQTWLWPRTYFSSQLKH